MERLKNFAAPALCAFFILLATFLLKSAPSSKLWKSYTTLSVPVQTDASLVDKVLTEQNCSGFVALEGQISESASDYEKRKSLYFFDKEKNYRLCYVPDSSAKAAERAAQILQANFHVNAFLGSKASFSYFPLLVCLAAFFAFLPFAENKAIFSVAAAPGVFYSFCNPFYAAAAAICLELYALFLCQKLWRRKGAAKALVENFYIALFFAAALLVSFAAGFKMGVLFAFNSLCSMSLALLLFNCEVKKEKNARFLPVYIRSAKRAAAMTLESLKKAFFVSAEIFLLFVFLMTGTNFLSSGAKRGLLFPAPKEYNESDRDFPTLEDYFVEVWNKAASPYRSLNKKYSSVPAEGEVIEMTHYEKTGDGIKSRRELLLTYDKSFKRDAALALEKSDFPCLEKVWKAQGRQFSTAYSAGGSENAGFGIAAALLIAALLPFFAALRYIFVLRRGNYEA